MSRKAATCKFLRVACPALSRLAASLGSAAFAWLLASPLEAQTYRVLHSFGGPDGATPSAELIADAWGNLYGTTSGGGSAGFGTVFKLDAANNYALTTLHSFAGSDGSIPLAAVIADASGNLYGTTFGGGTAGHGTVFKLDAANGYALTTLHSFAASDGSRPSAGLIADASGNLYGTTYGVHDVFGEYYGGTVFKLDAANDYALTPLHTFDSLDGRYPSAPVIADASGNLYGTTYAGGSAGYGTVFKLDAANNYALTTLHHFVGGLDGRYPSAAVTADASGNLYGTTYGAQYTDIDVCGTVFKLDAMNDYELTTLHSFGGEVADGCWLAAAVIADASGNLYGTTTGHSDPFGPYWRQTLFKLWGGASNYSSMTVLHTFVGGPDGAYPYAALIADAAANLFGTTTIGGSEVGQGGVVFSLLNGIPAPVTGIEPNSGPSSGGTAVTITGTGFSAPVSVRIGGNFATGVTVVSPTEITAITPPLPPGRLIDVAVANPIGAVSSGSPAADVLPLGFFSDFLDVPQTDTFHADVETVFRNGITAGCGGGYYCGNNPVTRAQTAVLLLKAEHGSAHVPPACTGIFPDVRCRPTRAFAVDWIEQLSNEGTTAGCGGGHYCPGNPVTRAQMAVLLLKAAHGSGYTPAACAGIFVDAPCKLTPAFAVDWIEQLYHDGITAGCGGGKYCPGDPVSRGQMAALLTRTFGLQ